MIRLFVCTAMLMKFCLCSLYAQAYNIELFRHETQGGHTNVWYASSDALKKMPLWTVGSEPPLSLGRAVEIAKTRIISEGGDTNLWIDSITVCPVFPGYKEYEGVYYYNIRCGGASYLGHFSRCIILMSGTIVEPTWLGTRPKSNSPWANDE